MDLEGIVRLTAGTQVSIHVTSSIGVVSFAGPLIGGQQFMITRLS
jgi:hypothetical protein